METEFSNKNTFELIIELVAVTIWPITFLLVLLIFRRNFSGIFTRLGTLKAGSGGIELSFQSKIEAAKKVFQQIAPATAAKSAQSIETFTQENTTPFAEILAMRSNLINYLRLTSEKEGIAINGLSPEMITEKLKETGGISIRQAKMIHTLLEVTAAANASATKEQESEIGDLMKKIVIT